LLFFNKNPDINFSAHNLHLVRSQSKDWKPNNLKLWEQ